MIKREPWFLGVDLGTGSCKSIIVDEQARALGLGVGPYDTGEEAPANAHEKWQEQNPKVLLRGLIRSVRAAITQAQVDPDACGGMSIGGALHSLVAVDAAGKPLTGVMTWADGRAVEQAERVRQTPIAAELYARTACPAHGMYPLYKIIWLREARPAVFEHCARFLTAKELIYQQLTGDYAVDYCLAAGSGLLNTHTLEWDEFALDLAGVSREQLSPLHSPSETRHQLRPDVAAQMGLPADIPLALGSSDAANSSIGAGAVHPWQATCMVGTSGALRVITPHPVIDSAGRSWCYAIDSGHWLVGGAINNGGLALSWLRDALNRALPGGEKVSFEDILRMAAQVEPGAQGLVCLPFFAGERSPNWNLKARAVFFGLTVEHDMRHMARALLEGVAFRFRSLHEMLIQAGLQVRQMRASGGFTQSDLWLQITASALKHELVIPASGETSALGAAFWPMIAAGLCSGIESLGDFAPLGATHSPDPHQSEIYDQIYPLFSALYQALQGPFDTLADLTP